MPDSRPNPIQIILTGGFLGSGKTTSIARACRHLVSLRKKVAVITNDQGEQQVDSWYLRSLGIDTREVTNGCFCCRYSEVNSHLHSFLSETCPDYIFAESVGSCTDLVSTIIKPLQHFKPELRIVLNVFVDAKFVLTILHGKASFADDSVRYIFKKQLEESDIIVINKIDLVTEEESGRVHRLIQTEYPAKVLHVQNSNDAIDVQKWLQVVDEFSVPANRDVVDIDYSTYGEGEQKLAWLDQSVVIQSEHGNAHFIARTIIRNIFNSILAEGLFIGHLKFFLKTESWTDKISFTASNTSADFKIKNHNTKSIEILINARVQAEPEILSALIQDGISEAADTPGCTVLKNEGSAFKPGFPTPTHRMR